MTKSYVLDSQQNMASFACYKFTGIGSKVLANRATVYGWYFGWISAPSFWRKDTSSLQKDAASDAA